MIRGGNIEVNVDGQCEDIEYIVFGYSGFGDLH